MSKSVKSAPALKKNSAIEMAAADIEKQLADQQLSAIYAERIRTQRTRSFTLNATARAALPAVEILHTLLGIELKIGKRRLSCPDWATARYLAVFARLGLAEVAVPYDITQISRLADDLESSWFRLHTLAEHASQGRSTRWRAMLVKALLNTQREAIAAAGAGPAIPQFIQNTKQRRK
jgi:hypothetical protein